MKIAPGETQIKERMFDEQKHRKKTSFYGGMLRFFPISNPCHNLPMSH